MPTLSLVIPCYNEELYVGSLLEDLCSQTLPPLQVIVADSNSTDKTLDVVRAFSSRLPLKIAHTKARTPGAVRNAGARLAAGEYLVFIDADGRVPADFVQKIATATKNGTIDFVSPLYSPESLHPVDRRVVASVNQAIKSSRLIGIGGVMCVRRRLHTKVGGFDEQMIKENDLEYTERLQKVGVSTAVEESLFVTFSSRRFKKNGRFVTLLYHLPRNSWVWRQIVNPSLKSAGKDTVFLQSDR